MKSQKQKILIIVGPTSSGKTSLAITLAKRFGGEVISADSRQVYRGLNIGTGKVTVREMQRVPHHLLDVTTPRKAYSADDYIQDARAAIGTITARGKLPIVAGGTGFYIDSLVGRITLPNVPPNKTLRTRLEKKSAVQLYALLQKKDPARARAMNTPSERNNKVRLIRAIEIATALQGRSLKEKLGISEHGATDDVLWIGILPSAKELDAKILNRLKVRLKSGMIAEAKHLHAAGLSYKRMTELGLEYRSLARFLQNKISRQELEVELSVAIRRYARKQITYWKRNNNITWYKPSDTKEIKRAVSKWIKTV